MKHLIAILGILGSIGLFYGGIVVTENSPGGGDLIGVLITFAMIAASIILLIITINVYLARTLGKKIGLFPVLILVLLAIMYGPTLYDEVFEDPPAKPQSSRRSESDLEPIVVAEKLGKASPKSQSVPIGVIKDFGAEIPQGEAIELLKIHSPRYDSPHFYIRSANGLTGYLSGTKICASTVWVNGLSKPCDSFSQKHINAPVKLGETADNYIEIMQRTYMHLQGLWHAEEDYGKDEAKVFMFGDSVQDKQRITQINYQAFKWQTSVFR